MKKIALYIISTLIILSLAIVGCATPVEGEYEITIHSFVVGSSAYEVCFGLGELINKHSPWLRATVVESSSNVENIKLMMDPANKKRIISHNTDASFYASREGVEPFDVPYTPLVIARENPFAVAMLGLDPDLKTYSDLKGKTISLLFPGSSTHTVGSAILKMLGIWDDVDVVAAGFGKAKDATLDGTIDAGSQSVNFLDPVDLPPATLELITTKPTYCVHVPFDRKQAVYDQLASEGKWVPFNFVLVPKERHPKFMNDWAVTEGTLEWVCNPEMPDDVIYEFCRILNEYKDEMVQYNTTAKQWTTQGFGEVLIEKQYWHPGAQKYWKKVGTEIPFVEPEH